MVINLLSHCVKMPQIFLCFCYLTDGKTYGIIVALLTPYLDYH
jgi:hypothetical protein